MQHRQQPEPRVFDCDKIDENKAIRTEIAQFLNGGSLSGTASQDARHLGSTGNISISNDTQVIPQAGSFQ